MSLIVNPAALTTYAGQLASLGDAAAAADAYAERYSSFPFGDKGLITELFGGHDQFASQVKDALNKIAGLCGSSDQALHQTAAYYISTDRTAADRLDATLPATPRTTGRTSQMDEGGETD